MMTEVELNRKLSELKMKDNENPGNLFTQIAAIRTWYSKDIAEEKILPALIMALPQQYKWLATQYGLLQSKGSGSDLEELEEALVAFWRSSYSNGSTSGGKASDDEMGLTSFEGTCYKCKEKGHKANTCPKNPTKKKFQGKCNLCGKLGHKKVNCFEDDKNASKRPKNWKSAIVKDEAGNVHVDGTGLEFQFSGICQVCVDEDLVEKPRDDSESIMNFRDMFKLEVSDEEFVVDEGLVEKPQDAFKKVLFNRDMFMIEMSDEEIIVDDSESLECSMLSRDMFQIEMSDEEIIVDAFESKERSVEEVDVQDLGEYNLALSVPDDITVLEGPDIWLADSGATVHSTPYDIGFIELQAVRDSDKVKVGSGEVLAAGKVGNIRGVVCDRHGESLMAAKLSTVMYIPKSKYNLLSLTQFLKNG